MKNAIALIAVAGIAGAASAQSYEVVLNSADATSGNGTNAIVLPGSGGTVEISVWFDGAGIDGFSGLETFAINMGLGGASELAGLVEYTEDLSGAETAPNSTSGIADFQNAADTWAGGRRPGAGSAFGGFVVSEGFRFAAGGSFPATFTAGGVDGAVDVLQGGSTRITGTQGNVSLLGAQAGPDIVNLSNPIEILRLQYVATNEGIHTIDLAYEGTAGFLNGSLASAENLLGQLVASAGGSIEVVPAPGAVALLGLGGLAAARRRRA